MASFYPEYLQRRFTNRASELATLTQMAADLRDGQPRHVAVFGLRRIGKTLLCQEQVRRLLREGQILPAYIDFEDICTAPELFAQRFIGLLCFWAFEHGEGSVEPYLSAERLLSTRAASTPLVVQTVSILISEMRRQKADDNLLLTLAFEFPERLAEELGRPMMCFLDEFTELSTLANYPGLGDPLKHFRAALQTQSRVSYVVAGSAISAMERLVRDHNSPLFLQFRALELHPLTAEDTQILTEKLLAGRPIPAAQAAVYTYTFGHPFYVTALAERLHDLGVDPDTISVDQVAQAFLVETLSARGQIYGYCRYLYEISLQKARGYGALKGILQILAEEESLSLTDIAGRLHRRPSTTQAYLRWLLEVDLLGEKDKRYTYRDPVLRFWVAQTTRGVEMDGFPRREDLDRLVTDLAERFQRTAAQLGRAKESELRELLRKLAGKSVPGIYFGRSEVIAIPAFERVEGFSSNDGQIELDALAEVGDGARWAVELKWRQKRAGEREMRNLLNAAATLHAQPWCISQLGFTPEALGFAVANGIFTSTAVDLEALQRLGTKL